MRITAGHRSSKQAAGDERVAIRATLVILGPVIGLIAGLNPMLHQAGTVGAAPTRFAYAASAVLVLWGGFSYYALRRADAAPWKAGVGALLSVAWSIGSAVVPFWILVVLTTW